MYLLGIFDLRKQSISKWAINHHGGNRFSGTDGRNVHNDIWSFDLNTGYWEQITALGYIPSPREGAASAVVDEVLYIFGGRAADGQLLGDLCAFKFSSM
jgi:hypothetical protein